MHGYKIKRSIQTLFSSNCRFAYYISSFGRVSSNEEHEDVNSIFLVSGMIDQDESKQGKSQIEGINI